MKNHIIIYSQGFGVEKDDRGLFTSMAKECPENKHVMFNYNSMDRHKNELVVAMLRAQSRKLREIYEEVIHDYDKTIIDIVAHSQGCIVAAIQNLPNIRETVFLAPPDNINKDRLKKMFDRSWRNARF